MKQWLSVLFGCLAFSYGNVAVHYGLESHSDNGHNDLWWNHAQVIHEQENASQSLEWGWFDYQQSTSVNGIRAYSGQEMSWRLSMQALKGLWWGQVQAGIQGRWTPDALVFQLIGARALLLDHGKWTPRVSLFRKPLAYYALPLSLSAFEKGFSIGTSFSTGHWEGDFDASWTWWTLVNDSTRFESSVNDLATPQIIQISHYSLYSFSPRFRIGYVLSGAQSDKTTQTPTQSTPAVAYQWVPAAAPILSGFTSLLLEGTLIQSPHFRWTGKGALPLVSAQQRRWENRSFTDWGTATLEATSQMNIQWGDWITHLSLTWRNTPWKHMQYFDSDAYQEWRWALDLQTSF